MDRRRHDDQVCVKGWRDGTYIHVAVDGQTKTLMIKYVLKDGEMVRTCTCSCGWTDEDMMIKYVLKDGEMVHTYM